MSDLPGFSIRAAMRVAGKHPAAIDPSQALKAIKEGRALVWLHVAADNLQTTATFLTEELGFHPLSVEDALSTNERPELHEYDGQLFLTMPTIQCGPDIDEFSDVGFFLGKNSLVTVSIGASQLIDHWFDRWMKHPDEVGKSPAFLLHALLDAVVDDYFPAADLIEDRVDDLEEKIFSREKTDVADALRLKRRLLEMRRRVTAIRDILNGILRGAATLIPGECRVYFQDVYDHTLRVAENIDLNRDILSAILDAQLSIVSNNLNQVMKRLTVIATILMTGSLIAGIFGMNFVHMPELKWTFGYPIALGLIAIAGIVEWLWFKKIGWL